MVFGDAQVFPGFLTQVLTQLFFPKPPTTFLTCFCRGERRKYAGKKCRLNRESNSKPPGHESDTLTTELYNLNLPLTLQITVLTHQQQTAFETLWEKEKLLLSPLCFLLKQIIVSPFVHIFAIISLFAAELEEPKIGI